MMALRTSSRRATAALRLLPRSRPLSTRTESDAFGPIEVSTEVLWGAQTQRSLQNFPIGGPAARMPDPVIKAFGVLKKCASQYNMGAGLMDEKVGGAIVAAADEVIHRRHSNPNRPSEREQQQHHVPAAHRNPHCVTTAAHLPPPVHGHPQVIAGTLAEHFPLVVFQTGSGTQVRVACTCVARVRVRVRVQG